jgi:hypothetical protein
MVKGHLTLDVAIYLSVGKLLLCANHLISRAKDADGGLGGQMSDFNSNPYPPRWLFALLLIVGLAVAGMILFAAFPSKGAEQQTPCIDPEMREQVRSLMLAGIDRAMREHAVKMFNIWQRDPTNQPKRAIAGMKSAIIAYAGSRAAAQRWSPPACER